MYSHITNDRIKTIISYNTENIKCRNEKKQHPQFPIFGVYISFDLWYNIIMCFSIYCIHIMWIRSMMMERDSIIIRTSVIGIVSNVLLASFKAAVGLIAGSIAIVLDAVNNLSDALSSVITIIGTKLAGKKPDKEHPYGHGRVEYITAVVIAVIVLYAGLTSLIESVKKIISPETPDYSPASLIIVGSAVAVKLILGRYVRSTGEKVSSDSLVASGKDALMDAVISASTLAAAVIFLAAGVSLEAWLGAMISIVIIRAGIEMLRESISDILGERADGEFTKQIRQTVASFPEVSGVYDLILHNYGPDMMIGSVHIEVPDVMTADRIDVLERSISAKVMEEHGVILAGIGIYSVNTTNDRAAQIHEDIRRTVMAHEFGLQMHGFYLDDEKKNITFDIILDFAAPDREKLYNEIRDEIGSKYPDYKVSVTLDVDVSD